MSRRLQVRDVQIHRLAIPMRMRFEHAAAARETADPVIVQISAASPYAEFVGFGETLARPYVTGETAETVAQDLAGLLVPRLAAFRPESFFAALEFIEALPLQHEGRIICAARAALELALLDLAGQVFQRRPAEVAGWLGLPGFGPPGCLETARYSGIVVGRTRAKLATLTRLQRWYGLRDFKIKAAVPGWEQNLEQAHRVLRRAIATGRATLRVDANGGWSLAEANEALAMLERCGVSAVEQPLSETHDGDLPWLAEQTRCDLIADESLLTIEDAQRLAQGGGVKVFNVRIAKNGGLMPALRIARTALAAGIDVQLGCLVGETSILSAAGVAFLESCPRVRFVEGAFGWMLLRDDVTRGSIRFGRGGRIAARRGYGLGVNVAPHALVRRGADRPQTIHL
jgi:muconate cycloisomerase